MTRARRLAGGLVATLGLGLLGAGAAQAAGDLDVVLRRAPGEVDVLTLNQYFGASLKAVLTASPTDFNAALVQVLTQAAGNHVRARLDRQAAAIAHRRPDLVGLQEVLHAECHDLPPTSGACAEPAIAGAFVDQLELTLQALQARHANYEVAARVVNFDIGSVRPALSGPGSLGMSAQGLPQVGGLDPGDLDLSLPEVGDLDPGDLAGDVDLAKPDLGDLPGLGDIPELGDLPGVPFAINGKLGRLVAYDQDVILRRHGIGSAPVAFACDGRQSAEGCSYATQASVAVGGVPIGIRRGFVGVDTQLRGQAYRFVNTHLETQEMAIQSGQAAELLVALAGTPPDRALILVGDMNSSPADVAPAETPEVVPPYRQLVAAGLVDAWAARFGDAPGFTCCQDATLRNEVSTLDQRIDLILARAQPLLVRQARVILDDPIDRTPARPGQARLWPSDHAGFEALLSFRARVR